MLRIFKGKVLVVRLRKDINRLRQWELCIFLPFITIEEHYHKNSDIEILHIWGLAQYLRRCGMSERRYKTRFLVDFLRFFSVPRNAIHGAKIGWTGLVVVSCQKYQSPELMNSVTQDYHRI